MLIIMQRKWDSVLNSNSKVTWNPHLMKKKKNGCGSIAGKHWLNYVTPNLLGLRRYPIGPLIARTPNWLVAIGSQHILQSELKLIETGEYTSIETKRIQLIISLKRKYIIYPNNYDISIIRNSANHLHAYSIAKMN